MSTTLNLTELLLARGILLQDLGRDQDALAAFEHLATFRDLSPEVAEEAHVRRAEILLKQRKFRQARRHLAAAIVQQPQSARYHHLMATALREDDRTDPHRAADHYRRSLERDPSQAGRWAEFGLLALRLGQTDDGLGALRRAAELAPNEPEVIASLVQGLREVGRADEARAALTAALFRNPRDHRFKTLWSDFRFRQLREEQDAERLAAFADAAQGGPRILPFRRQRSAFGSRRGDLKRTRRDRGSPPAAPHLPGFVPWRDRKHA